MKLPKNVYVDGHFTAAEIRAAMKVLNRQKRNPLRAAEQQLSIQKQILTILKKTFRRRKPTP